MYMPSAVRLGVTAVVDNNHQPIDLSLLPSCMSICRSEQILLTEQWAKQYSGMVKVVSCHPGE